MFSAGAAPNPGANGDDIFMVEVSTKTMRRFITSDDQFANAESCVVLSLTFPGGTTVEITGVLQLTGSIQGYATPFASIGVRLPEAATEISGVKFDVEAYSTGLVSLKSGPFNPTLPANIIAGTDYGFAWSSPNEVSRPGPYSYTVVSCAGRHDVYPGKVSCSTKVDYFNQITPDVPPAPCRVLAPMSPQ